MSKDRWYAAHKKFKDMNQASTAIKIQHIDKNINFQINTVES